MSRLAAPNGAPQWRTKNEAVYQVLRARILSGEIAPGIVIEPEMLAEQLGVSTTPLREAVRRLQVEQLLEAAEHHKVRVSPLHPRELRELFTVRLSLEPLAAQLAAENATAVELVRFHELVSHEPGNGEELQRMNRELHTAIYRASGNAVLINMLDQLWDRADRYRQVLAAKQPSTARHEHREHVGVVTAISRREPKAAHDAMHHHLVESIDEVSHLLDQMREPQAE